MALYSVIFSNRRLTRPGVSAELRKVFVKKHSHYVYLFTGIWIIQLAQSFEHLFGPGDDTDDIQSPGPFISVFKQMSGVMDIPAGVALFSTGLLLSAIRFNEPIFRFLCKKFILQCFGIIIEEEKEGLQTETISAFLASSLNIELVHVILKGIKKFNKLPSTSGEYDAEMFDNMRICRLNRIQIKDPKSWDKAKLQEKIEEKHAQTLTDRKESLGLFKGIGSFKTKAVNLGQKNVLD